MEEDEKKLVKCVNCGNVWETKAKRPQCSICKSTRVEYVDSTVDQHVDSDVDLDVESTENQHAETKSNDEFFELDDVDVDELLNEEKESNQESRGKGKSKGKNALKKIGLKIHNGLLYIGLVLLVILVALKVILDKRVKKQAIEIIEDEEVNDPYSALG